MARSDIRSIAARRVCVAALCISALACVLLVGCVGQTSSELTLSPRGVDGVRPGSTLAAVREQWKGIVLAFPNSGASGADLATDWYCRHGSPVLVGFWTFPPVGDPNWDKAELFFVWFFGKVRTEKGVRVGSTVRELQRDYGSQLEPVSGGDQLGGVQYHVAKVNTGPVPRSTVVFGTNRGRVVAIGLSKSGEAARAVRALEAVFEARC
jgi:hypothetical protein